MKKKTKRVHYAKEITWFNLYNKKILKIKLFGNLIVMYSINGD